MHRPSRPGRLATLAVGILAASIAWLSGDAGLVHLGLVAALTAATTLVALVTTARLELAAVAGLTVAAWPMVHRATTVELAVALLATGLLVVELEAKLLPAIALALLSGAAAILLLASPTMAAIAAILTLAAVLARPVSPTQATLGGIRAAAMFGPAVIMAVLLAGNIVTGRAAGATVAESLERGVGLFGLTLLGSAALLGIATLLESQAPLQAATWNALCLGAGLVPASILARDPSLTLGLIATVAGPIGLAAAILATRARATWGHWTLAAPIIFAAIQWGLVLA